MLEVAQQVEKTIAVVRAKVALEPKVGIVLGSGLGGLAKALEDPRSTPYTELPHFPQSTSLGHRGMLSLGHLEGTPVAMMEGRLHRYEGYSAEQVVFPIRVLAALGVDTLIVSNAAGGLNPKFRVGDLMVLEDQINLMFDNPLIGINDDAIGPRFPDMSTPFDPDLREVAHQVARAKGFAAWPGVYIGYTGPSYETRAEYRMLRTLGADAVGMSTVPEVIAAVHRGLKVFGLSVITNLGLPDALGESTAEEVVEVAAQVGENAEAIVRAVVAHAGRRAG